MDTKDEVLDLAAQAEVLIGAGRYADALLLLSVAQRSDPANVRLLKLISRVFIAQDRTDLAIGALLAAVEIEPGDASLHHAVSILLLKAGRVQQALAHSIQCFEQAPTPAHATALGAVLMDVGLYQEALGVFDHAIELDRGHWEALSNRALALQGLERFEDAILAGRCAVDAAPGVAGTRFNLGCALLGVGRMTAEAWDLFESRLDLPGNPAWVKGLAARRWRGEDIAAKTILLHAEQGFGDTIQFMRYLPLVARRAGRVILAVQPALLRFVRDVMGVEDAVPVDAPLPPFDVMSPLLSLPRLFGTTTETIPPSLPIAGWPFGACAARSDGLRRVGLVWRGSRTFGDNRHRSLPVERLGRLASIPGVAFVSLQRHEVEGWEGAGSLEITDAMVGVTDFAETAEIIAGLDLVVTVDTAVGHLAGTMGKPVWVLTRWRGCWRWMQGRTDSPWYPSVRIVRQARPNDWTDTLDRLRGQLVAWSEVN